MENLNTKQYEDLALKNTPQYEEVEKSLDIVQSFIKERDLIIYGGMAIDYALKKLNNPGIYSEGNIPDYDVLSPNYNEDARDLAIILKEKGITGISDINASHFSTRRVRVQYEPVADISYMPKNIYDKIPTLVYNGLRFVHPHYQMIDMHKELAVPFENPPREVVLHRSAKTIKRFKMLVEMYPIRPTTKYIPDNIQSLTLPLVFTKNNLVGGFAAYGLIYDTFKSLFSGSLGISQKLAAKIKSKEMKILYDKLIKDIIPVTTEYKKDTIKFGIPINMKHLKLTIYSEDFTIFEKNAKDTKKTKIEYYNSFVETLRPRTLLIPTESSNGHSPKSLGSCMEIFDVRGSILTYSKINEKNIDICSTQSLLLYFLQKDFEVQHNLGLYTNTEVTTKTGKTPIRDEIFIRYYVSLVNIIILCENLFIDSDHDSESIDPLYYELPFFLSAKTYGSFNYSTDYLISIKSKLYKFHDTPYDKRELLQPPFGFYPETSVRPDVFKVEDSDYFSFDGKKRDKPFTHRDLTNLKL